MSNETSSAGSETQTADTPVTGTPAPVSETPQTQQTTKSQNDLLARIAELEHSHKNAVEERDRHRKKLSKYEEAEKVAQEAALSEVEKATKRATDAEQRMQQVQQQLVTAQVKLAAQAKGIIDPDLAALAIQAQLEYGEDGMATNIEQVLEKLVKAKPYLLPPAAPAEPEAVAPPEPFMRNSVPTIPAMNPGRASIQSPGTTTPGRPPRLSEVYTRQ